MDSRKERAFKKKCRALVEKAGRLEDDSVKRVVKILDTARREVAAEIASTPWEAHAIQQLQGSIRRVMQEFGEKYGVDMRERQYDFWELGIDRFDLPLREVGIFIAIPEIDMTALGVMQDYASALVKGLADDAQKRISQEITMGIMGQKTPYEVMTAVGRNLKEPSIFRSIAARAETITRNEAGRVMEMAAEARGKAAAEVVPGLGREWRHGAGSRVPRASHLVADGQQRKFGEPFNVGGENLMHPRDPAGSAGNTINCSCYTVPWHPDWDAAVEKQGQRAA